jgi:ankyrin repeat protein
LPQREGITPLMVAVGAGASSVDTRGKFRTELDALETADALIAAGALVDERDERGRTALHYAAAAGYTDVAKSLVAHGASLALADADGVTPVDAANGKLRGGRRGGAAHPATAEALQALLATIAAR